MADVRLSENTVRSQARVGSHKETLKMNQTLSPEAVRATLEDYARTYCAKDIDGLMAVFDDSDDISVIGTGAEELCVGRQEVRQLFLNNFSEAQATQFEWGWSHISQINNQAVVAVILKIHIDLDGVLLQVPIRWTVALRHNGKRWVWLHRHASTAAASQDEGQAYPQSN